MKVVKDIVTSLVIIFPIMTQTSCATIDAAKDSLDSAKRKGIGFAQQTVSRAFVNACKGRDSFVCRTGNQAGDLYNEAVELDKKAADGVGRTTACVLKAKTKEAAEACFPPIPGQ